MFASVPSASARVFWRWRATADSARALEAGGGRIVYTTEATINAGRGRLTVAAFDGSLPEVVARLRRVFDGATLSYAGGTLALGQSRAGGRVVRLAAAELGAPGRTLVFSLEQSEAEAEASRRPPPAAALKDLPPYPGSEPLFLAQDERSALGVAVARTAAAPAEVHRFYQGALAAAGWTPALPAGAFEPPSLRLYVRQERMCAVLVEPPDAEGRRRITVLHKERGIAY